MHECHMYTFMYLHGPLLSPVDGQIPAWLRFSFEHLVWYGLVQNSVAIS